MGRHRQQFNRSFVEIKVQIIGYVLSVKHEL